MKTTHARFSRRLRGITLNSGKLRAVGFITNAEPFGGGTWELIAPYGEFPTPDRRKTQKFTREQATVIVNNFNAARLRLGAWFRGVPIYHGHPDVDPKNWPDDRCLGKIREIEARADGLWCRPEFNALGRDNQRECWWAYLVAAWIFPATNSANIAPDELLSVGLVNTLPGSAPWANSAPDWAPGEKNGTTETGWMNIGGRKVAVSNPRERHAAVQTEVEKRMTIRRIDYDTAYKSVKTDPDFVRIFEMMKSPATL